MSITILVVIAWITDATAHIPPLFSEKDLVPIKGIPLGIYGSPTTVTDPKGNTVIACAMMVKLQTREGVRYAFLPVSEEFSRQMKRECRKHIKLPKTLMSTLMDEAKVKCREALTRLTYNEIDRMRRNIDTRMYQGVFKKSATFFAIQYIQSCHMGGEKSAEAREVVLWCHTSKSKEVLILVAAALSHDPKHVYIFAPGGLRKSLKTSW